MDSQRGIFETAGPVHLTFVDWTSPHHRRSIAASLVQGVYVLERDRQRNRHGHEARAPQWWNFFHFKLIEQLIDTADSSIFGAIYQFKPPIHKTFCSTFPNYVIAFRGTITNNGSISHQDLKLDLRVLDHGLHRTSRFETTMQAVLNLVSHVGTRTKIWLAGHSLGAAIALLAGKNMVKCGVFLETYLFNPPFFSTIEKIKNEKWKDGMRIAGSYITAWVAGTVKGQRMKSEEYFAILASWVPHIFVNKGDTICSGYLGYFENRRRMEDRGAGDIGRFANQSSIREVFLNLVGRECEPLHLLPSARVTVNLSGTLDFRTAHGIHQWWRSDAHLQSQEYLFE